MENLKNEKSHVLIVIFSGQGHINPSLQLSKRLISLGIKVTLSTSLLAFNKIKTLPNIKGLSFAPFSDGYDGNFKGSFNEFHSYYSSIKSHGYTDYSDYFKNCDSKDKIIELPGLPPLSPIDFPSFVFDDVECNNWAAESIKRQIDILNSEENPKILVNTFDDLEFDALRILKNVTIYDWNWAFNSINFSL
ncbi:hypothetical protein MTR67_041752 [Solanum verrucosum]|uniref:Uncharacterized protein n=1 Tax=Solanum verrucosum TaxID=315347 RepID=A0AAF0UL86_SOLVR|nr:hypothetical protein MTR67_041752 [Solanum verrucosum]